MINKSNYDERTPYQLPFPREAQKEIVIPDAIPDDERLWVAVSSIESLLLDLD